MKRLVVIAGQGNQETAEMISQIVQIGLAEVLIISQTVPADIPTPTIMDQESETYLIKQVYDLCKYEDDYFEFDPRVIYEAPVNDRRKEISVPKGKRIFEYYRRADEDPY
jgi:hypothetical protein